MGGGLFVTGTDTGVGKTLVTAALAAYCREVWGLPVGVMKPVHTGARRRADGTWFLPDTQTLLRASGISLPLDRVTPYRAEAPVAPPLAPELGDLDPAHLLDCFRHLQSRAHPLLVEGIGGILVPLRLRPPYRVLDLIRDLDLPTVVVARTALGTLNHTLLTLQALEGVGIPVLGIWFNQTNLRTPGPGHFLIPQVLQAFTRVPVLGVLSYQKGLRRAGPRNWQQWLTRGTPPRQINRLLQQIGCRKPPRPPG